MHELVRQYARERLAVEPAVFEETAQRHAATYARLLEQRGPGLRGPEQPQVIAELVQELGNIRPAWDWAVAHRGAEQLIQASDTLFWLYEARSNCREGVPLFGQAIRGLQPPAGGSPLPADRLAALALGQTLSYQGYFCLRQGQHRLARDVLRQSYALLASIEGEEARAALATAGAFLGAATYITGEYDVVVGGAVVTSVVLSLIGVAPSAIVLALLFLIGGFGSAAFHPAGASLARAAETGHRSLVVSLFGAGGTLGIALGPLLVISVLATYGLGATPWLMLPGLLLAGLLAVAAPPSVNPMPARSRIRAGLRSLPRQLWLLALAGIFESLAFVTFMNGMPLWLVAQRVPRDSALIGWTLAAFALAAAAGGILASTLMGRVPAAPLAGGTMLLALVPLLGLFAFDPGSGLFFAAVVLAGGLMHASFPLLIVRAQDLAPQAVATASGMLMGFATGVAGLLYVGVGYLQEVVGIATAMQLAFLALVPAALLAAGLLRGVGSTGGSRLGQEDGADSCGCAVCRCASCVSPALNR